MLKPFKINVVNYLSEPKRPKLNAVDEKKKIWLENGVMRSSEAQSSYQKQLLTQILRFLLIITTTKVNRFRILRKENTVQAKRVRKIKKIWILITPIFANRPHTRSGKTEIFYTG